MQQWGVHGMGTEFWRKGDWSMVIVIVKDTQWPRPRRGKPSSEDFMDRQGEICVWRSCVAFVFGFYAFALQRSW
jgi:hypothetical protein